MLPTLVALLVYRPRSFPWREAKVAMHPIVQRPASSSGHSKTAKELSNDATVLLVQLTQVGSIANLRIRPQQMPARAWTLNEATVDVEAAGLNFRDVLNVLGLDPTGLERAIGGEVSGIVSRMRLARAHVLASEYAYGLVPGGLRTRVPCDARYIRCMRAPILRPPSLTRTAHWLCIARFSFSCIVVCRRCLPVIKPSRYPSCGSQRTTALFRRSCSRCRMCLSMPLLVVSALSR